MAFSFRDRSSGLLSPDALKETPARPARPARAAPRRKPAAAPPPALTPAERRAAMSGLDDVEFKWAAAGLVLATLIGGFLTYVLAATHPTRSVKVHGHTKLVPLSSSWLLIYIAVLLFCGVGVLALRRRKRSLVVFSIMISGFAITEFSLPIGFGFIVLGGWLMWRAYRIQQYGTANAKMAAREAATRPPRRERKAAAAAAAQPVVHQPAKANKRYTPKAPPRKKIPKPTE